jgi:hypothetical protein
MIIKISSAYEQKDNSIEDILGKSSIWFKYLLNYLYGVLFVVTFESG